MESAATREALFSPPRMGRWPLATETREPRPIGGRESDGFVIPFDKVDHEWMMKFLGHRIGDRRALQMVHRFLKAGVIEEGQWQATAEGTPQGGVISPLLANLYLHYALDLWFEKVFRRTCRGTARLIRYADDCAPGNRRAR